MEPCAGVPANWIVLVVGAIVDWAFAEKVANAMKTTRQNKSAAQFPRKADLLCANVTAVIEGLTLAFPSRKPWLPGSLLTFKKASSNWRHAFTSGSADQFIVRRNTPQLHTPDVSVPISKSCWRASPRGVRTTGFNHLRDFKLKRVN
jgi:hypothetical protein